MSNIMLLFIILIEGFVTIAAEILTIRQLLPVAGNSVVITSLVIGVFLLFLAYGYRRGGFYEGNYFSVLKSNFCKTAFLFGIGLSQVFISWFFYFCLQKFSLPLLWTVTLYLLLVTAPLVYFLGQTVPITMNLVKEFDRAGAIGGKILHLSTIGSFFGAVLTSLILMNYLGVAWTVWINCLLLSALCFVLLNKSYQDFSKVVLLGTCLIAVYIINVKQDSLSSLHSNAYNSYRMYYVENKGDPENTKITQAKKNEIPNQNTGKLLLVNDSPFSYLGRNYEAMAYVEMARKILFSDLKLKDKDILVLGAGGFTLTATGNHENRVTYVDIDKDLKGVVQKYFLEKIHGNFVGSDARAFLNTTPNRYDVIVSDAYNSASAIPAHLLTKEYFQTMRNRLKDQGLAIILIIGFPSFQDDYTFNVNNTIQSVFPRCVVMLNQYVLDKPAQMLYVCRKNLAQEPEERSLANVESSFFNKFNSLEQTEFNTSHSLKTYTDNMNRITLDFFNSIIKFVNKKIIKD